MDIFYIKLSVIYIADKKFAYYKIFKASSELRSQNDYDT